MKFTIEWLKEYINTTRSADEICKKLNEIGLEVEKELPKREIFDKVVVAEIQECENHPDSDHLHICKVFDGTNTYQIVCGAPNARKGIKVALALVGAYIPSGDFRIKKTKIRGIESCGMMCSEREMGIGNDHNGIMELPEECKIGKLWVDEFNALEKMEIEVSITPNRGDATSVYGIARDLSACGFGELKNIKDCNIKETIKNNHFVEVNIGNCQYFCREIKGLDVKINTPKYILQRNALNGCGDNGVVVNILNYIMFEYGQPMHSYDLDKIGNKIIVDYAKKDKFTTLKGEEIKYDKDKIVMVSDENKDLCVAGIIGGDDCKTTNETKNILLECAYFPTTPITIGGQELKIVSDARFRYERGVNPDLTRKMIELATSMIVSLCGGEVSNVEFSGKISDEKIVNYRLSTTKKLLGFDIPLDRTIEILTKLQFVILEKDKTKIVIKIPRFRHDIENEADIAEELARIEGYDKIPSVLYQYSNQFVKNNFDEKLKAKKYLSCQGLQECVSVSFCNYDIASLFGELNDDLKILNPISSDLNYLRPTLIVSLLEAIKTNESQILENQLAFFEEGMYFTSPEREGQHSSIAGVYYGKAIKSDHFQEGRPFDIFDAKKTLFGLLENVYKINVKKAQIEKCEKKYTHPTRSFNVKIRNKDGEKVIAIFGEISPIVLKCFGIKHQVCFFEVFNDVLPICSKENNCISYIEHNNIQPIVRDIAFIVDEEMPVEKLLSAYKDPIISSINVVDIFKMPITDKKSIALRYIFTPNDLMTIEQINELMANIIKVVEDKTGGKVRSNS